MTNRLTALGFVALAAVTSYAVLAGGDVIGLAAWLRRHGHPVYATWLVWVVVAPLLLTAAGLLVRRSPWPWVVAVTLQLAALVAAQARLGHLVDRWSWAVVAPPWRSGWRRSSPRSTTGLDGAPRRCNHPELPGVLVSVNPRQHQESITMRPTAYAALAATTALIGLGTTTTAEARVAAPRAEVVKEKGIVLECTGQAHGLAAYVNLYENDAYTNYVQVILNDDPKLAKSREPADILDAGEIRTGVRIAGKRARVVGTATRVGPRRHVHEEYDDAGQHIVADGFHRRLAHDLVLRYDGDTVPLKCAPAFYYSLNVTKTDTTGG